MIKIGLFENIFKKQKIERGVYEYFKSFSAYSPAFTSFEGGVYEMELTRAIIHSFATHCAKLKPEINGSAYKHLEKVLQFKPNPYMDTYKFLYRIATILSVNNNAIIVPLYESDGETIAGYYPICPSRTEIVQHDNKPYMRYTFANGQCAAMELDRVGIMTQFQYKDDFFGEDNQALNPTLQLIHTQNEGIIEGVKNSANIRFMARLAQTFKDKTIEEERKRFVDSNLSSDNKGGVMLFDAKYAEVKQISSQPFIVNRPQMELIQENAFNYFGTNINILQNNYTEEQWGAYYEGKVEPFAIQLSIVQSNMTYTPRELACKNEIIYTTNKLQYASNQTKLNVSTQLFDRALLNRDGVMDIWNMAHVEGGEKYYIRKEYAEVNKLHEKGEDLSATKNTGAGISQPAKPDPVGERQQEDGK